MNKPFDYVNSISQTKKDMMADGDDLTEKGYLPFITNRHFSYFMDTVMFANEMNKYPDLDKRLQYDFLRLTIRSGKRYHKKASSHITEDQQNVIDAVKFVYGYNNERALEVMEILSPDQKEALKTMFCVGIKKSK